MEPITPQGMNQIFAVSSPVTLLGVLVAILRERFDQATYSDPEVPYHWKPDLKETGIFIESGFNDHIETRNVRPGIWVDRDQTAYTKISIGNRDQMPVEVPRRLEYFLVHADTDISIDCTSKERGESMLIGSVVQDFLQMSARYIQACFGLRDISPVVMNKTVPYERDRGLMNTQVQFRVSYETRWATLPIVTVLNGISIKIADKTDPELYFREIAMRDK